VRVVIHGGSDELAGTGDSGTAVGVAGAKGSDGCDSASWDEAPVCATLALA
jgi:hypothetical protein